MKLKLYNTLTREKDPFVPIDKNQVGMYSCWPTVYSIPHIWNLRATFTADLIRNTLKLLGYNVKAVMNITDVGHLVSDWDEGEDKMEKWARREWKTSKQIAEEYEDIFRQNMKDLNIDEFDVMPRATDHIKEQIELIKMLEEKWYTYIVQWDGIYMDTSKVENYGELMWPNYKKRLADLNAWERVDMKWKKNPTDFALWKFSPENEKRQMEWNPKDYWASWPIGFPGWHIECSAMSWKHLWEQFDIHHGGADHITIHHPNEIAQSECAFGCHPWVKYRVHNEFLQVDGGKMSKSLGNVYNLEDIKAKDGGKFSPLDLRYFYFMAQYWNFQNFTWDGLNAAKKSRKNLNWALCRLANNLWIKFDDSVENMADLRWTRDETNTFYDWLIEALSDNIDTPKLLSKLFEFCNKYSNVSQKNSTEDLNWIFLHYWMDVLSIEESLKIIHYLNKTFLKLDFFKEEEFLIPIDEKYLAEKKEVTVLAEQRKQAKLDKNYALADELRNQIKDMWWEIKDIKEEPGYEIGKI